MRRRLALASVVLLGAALRFYPIWFGLPYAQARPDETASLGYALKILDGDPNPHFFHWPSLSLYLFAGLFAAARWVRPVADFVDYALLARACVALAGTTTVLVLARFSRRVVNDRVAILAALFLAISPLHVRESHFAMTDVLMTMLAMGCLALLADATDEPSWRRLALAGLAGGLATSTKYSAAPLLLAGLALPGAGWRSRLAYSAAFAGGFVAGTPYALADFETFRADLLLTRTHLSAGHVGGDPGPGWIYHLRHSLPYGLGIPVFVAAVPGCALLVARSRRAAWLLAAFALPFFVAIGSGRTVFFRYILPLVPLACLAAAMTIHAAGLWLAPRARMPAWATTIALATIVGIVPFAQSTRMDVLLGRTDSRVLAVDWLAPRLRAGDTLHDAGGDYTKLDLTRAAFHEWRYDAVARSFGDPAGRSPDWLVLYDSPLTEYADVPASLRTLAADRYTLAHEVRAIRMDARPIFDRQDAFFLPIAGFEGVERPGPNVYIYSLKRLR